MNKSESKKMVEEIFENLLCSYLGDDTISVHPLNDYMGIDDIHRDFSFIGMIKEEVKSCLAYNGPNQREEGKKNLLDLKQTLTKALEIVEVGIYRINYDEQEELEMKERAEDEE